MDETVLKLLFLYVVYQKHVSCVQLANPISIKYTATNVKCITTIYNEIKYIRIIFNKKGLELN